MRGYQALSNAGAKTGHLGAKTRELIALAVAVTRQCDGCITVHTDAAAKHGATHEEVAEAISSGSVVPANSTSGQAMAVQGTNDKKGMDHAAMGHVETEIHKSGSKCRMRILACVLPQVSSSPAIG